MTEETSLRINAYRKALPHMRQKVSAAALLLLIAVVTAVTASYAWLTVSSSPEVSGMTTTLAANGSLEIALAKEDGSQPDETDIDESITSSHDVTITNLQWGNLVNLSDDSYGIENLALRPARLNTASLLTNPLWGAVYGSDGRVTNLDSNYAYVKYNGTNFLTSNNTYGVRAIASYIATIADSTQQIYNEKVQAVVSAHQKVNELYSAVPGKFDALGTMISKYAQDKLDGSSPGTNLAPYLGQVSSCFEAVYTAMVAQKDAYVALANFQNYMYAQNNSGTIFSEVTWDQLVANKAAYNTDSTSTTSKNGIISLVGLTQFITDLATMESDIYYLNLYYEDYQNNGTAYYWGSKGTNAIAEGPNINTMIAHLIDHSTMTIDLEDNGTEVKVTGLSSSDASALLSASGKSRKAYIYNGILKRFEQSSVDESYRLNGNASCTIKVSYVMTITVYGKAYTKASGPCDFMTNYSQTLGNSSLVANDAVAEDTYGLVVDLWVRTNAEETCLTLEGATTTNEDGTIVSYDGVNRVWGSTGEAVLTTDSTTQGGGSCYIYYADTPEDMARSLNLLEAMKVAFVDQNGNLLARASMDTVNYYAVNGRITVPLVLDTDTQTTYIYTNDLNEEVVGRAITTLYTDSPVRIETIVYLDGDLLTNEDVLAAAEIQGQLNLQFGSSTSLTTVGNNELMDDTSSVTATVSKNTMDYDTAETDDDLTTNVFVNVEGTDPTTMTAFFVRAINSTQGSREATMTFTKQADGTWTSSYQFTAPGTYYLRYVRLDGVDYALADPPKVEIAGFSIESLSWGEIGDSAVIRTSDSIYTEEVTVKFASSDQSKLPSSVQARFVREDGNIVNVPLTYNSSTSRWVGTGTFSSSGVYTLEYLVFDNKYKDLESLGMTKTLDLSLGMYVAVYNNASDGLTNQYESGQLYSKAITAKIYDNTGKEMENLTGAVLYYSNGGSATGTVNTDLVWNEVNGCYDGTLPIVNAGRYRFSSVMLESSYLTKCTESPTYMIISPDPPIYDTTSSCTYTGSNIQFAPLTNDAVIDNIRIKNAESASIQAVVYNSLSKGYYTLTSAEGAIFYTGSSWSIQLPTYTLDLDLDGDPVEGAQYTQEGIWTVLCLYISDCYDSSSNYRGEDDPIIWVGTDETATQYLNDFQLKKDQSIDFSRLSTQVSCSLNVSVVSGQTSLGSSSAAFMSHYAVSDLGMYVLLTDDAGNVIPSSKVSDVTLNIKYIANSTSNTYGYKVMSSYAPSYVIKLNAQDAEDGYRTVSEVNGAADADWQYVGVYQVQNLQVTIGSTTVTYQVSDNIGLAQQYTITTAGPAAENITLLDENIAQRNTVIGKTGDNITGTFLQGGDPGITAKVTLTTEDNSNTQYVVLDDVSMQLILTHQGGSQANGGYTFTKGTSEYETITMTLTNSSGTYKSASTAMLAGTYTVQLKATVGSVTTTKDLKDISVYSVQPTLKVTGVSPSTSTSFKMNTYTGENSQYYSNAVLVDVQNYYDDYLANVYIKAERTAVDGLESELVDYVLPTVSVTLSNIGTNFASATATVSGSQESFTFAPSTLTASAAIGTIGSGTFTYEASASCGSETVEVPYEIQNAVGEQTIQTITIKDAKGASYTLKISDSITIREKAEAPASISYVSVSGYTTPSGQSSTDGDSITITLPTSIGTTVSDYEKTDESVDWTTVSSASQNLTYYVLKSCNQDQAYSAGGRCSSATPAKYTATFTYYLYTRTTLVETKTSTTQTWRATYGVVGWNVGGVEYAPGETITVSGAVTATPVIGIVDEVQIGADKISTVKRTTITDTYNGTQDVSKQASSSTSNSAAETAAKAYYSDCKPSGYEWFDATTPTYDGHYVTPQVETITQS